jgi:hypothetical protein
VFLPDGRTTVPFGKLIRRASPDARRSRLFGSPAIMTLPERLFFSFARLQNSKTPSPSILTPVKRSKWFVGFAVPLKLTDIELERQKSTGTDVV